MIIPGLRFLCFVLLTIKPWLNAKSRQCRDRLLHGQADNVCVRAVNFCDDLRSATLRGVSAGLVQRIHFREVIFDGCAAQTAKTNTRDFVKSCRSCGREMTNENGGANFVSSSAQTLKNLRSLLQIRGLADHFGV